MTGLSDKQRRFIDEYMRDSNGAQAALRAGYSARSASKLLSVPLVRAEIDRRQAEIARDTSISTASLIADADRAQGLAEKAGNASAMVAAIQLKARLVGLEKPDPTDTERDGASAQDREVKTAAKMFQDAAVSLGLPRDAKPDQVIGAASTTTIWPPEVYRIAHAAQRENS